MDMMGGVSEFCVAGVVERVSGDATRISPSWPLASP